MKTIVLLVPLVVLSLVAGARAAEIDFGRQLHNLDGTVIKEQYPDVNKVLTQLLENVPSADILKGFDQKAMKPLTLRTVCVNSLLASESGSSMGSQAQISGEEKVKRYELARRIHASTAPLDMTSEEIVLLKRMVQLTYVTLVVGQVWEMLENKDGELAKKGEKETTGR
jgi:hypothetical protein